MKRKLLVLMMMLMMGTLSIASAASQYVWPTTNKVITSHMSTSRQHPVYGVVRPHEGTDIGVTNQPCYAIAAGKITTVSYDAGGWGNYIIIDVGNNMTALYAHLSEVKVSNGQKVSKGQVVAISGATGGVSGPHLHIEIRKNGVLQDPEVILKDAPIPSGTPGIFTDISTDHWGYNDVLELHRLGIVNGRSDGTFGTNDSITVEEFLALLSRIAVKKGAAKANGTVYLQSSSAMNTRWSYNDYAALMKVIGKKSGESSDLGKGAMQLILGSREIPARYKAPIHRQEAAAFMGFVVADGSSTSANLINLKDWNSVRSELKTKINEVIERGIMKGSSKSGGVYLNPSSSLTRVEACALLNRLYKNL